MSYHRSCCRLPRKCGSEPNWVADGGMGRILVVIADDHKNDHKNANINILYRGRMAATRTSK